MKWTTIAIIIITTEFRLLFWANKFRTKNLSQSTEFRNRTNKSSSKSRLCPVPIMHRPELNTLQFRINKRIKNCTGYRNHNITLAHGTVSHSKERISYKTKQQQQTECSKFVMPNFENLQPNHWNTVNWKST